MDTGDCMNEKIMYHERGKDPLYKIWHASKKHLIMYFHSDGGSIVCAEKVFPIKKGVLVLIAADTYHFTMPDDPETYDRSKLWVTPETFSKLLGLLREQSGLQSLQNHAVIYSETDPADQGEIDSIFRRVAECAGEDAQELIHLCGAMQLLLYLYQYSKESVPSTSGVMGNAIEYIMQNIGSDLDIDAICSAVNISKYHFCRKFKQHTGMTVMQYILKTRIMLAKSELKSSRVAIGEISEKYGFSSVSYFCRVFKEEEGCSPLQYRKKNCFNAANFI